MFMKKEGKKHKIVSVGIAHVNAGFNNTIITITDENGNTLSSSSSGKMGFKGAKKGTPYAAQVAAENAVKIAIEKYGLKTVTAILRGPGGGRENGIRALQTAGLIVNAIRDITPTPHNGCRPPKRRRV